MSNNKLVKKVDKNALKKLNEVSDMIPSVDVLDFFNKLTEAYKEDQITRKELARIEAQREILIMEISERYNLYHKVFDRIFDERDRAINKSFEIIDKGINDNDRELITAGLHSLSKVVASSPFANLNELSSMLERNRLIEI